MSPTARSLAHLREQGYLAEVVERWIPGANIRKDLFSWIDIMAIRGEETLAVQTTAAAVAARVKKITESDTIAAVRKAGWRVVVHGWTKRANGKYALREIDLS